MNVSEQDRARISTAIRAAEKKTSGEIVCVLAQSSSDVTALPILIATVAALALPWLLVALTAMSVHRILVLQILAFLTLTLVLCVPRVRAALAPRAARRAVAHRAAMEQFTIRGIACGALCAHHRRRGHCGSRTAIRMAGRHRCTCRAH
jgi:putative membrane protein